MIAPYLPAIAAALVLAICSAQMLLTLPLRRFLQRARQAAQRLVALDPFDLRVSHGAR